LEAFSRQNFQDIQLKQQEGAHHVILYKQKLVLSD